MKYLFVYGSLRGLRLANASLENYQLVLVKSNKINDVVTIVPKENCIVYGNIDRINKSFENAIDRYERVSENFYKKHYLEVLDWKHNVKRKCLVYILNFDYYKQINAKYRIVPIEHGDYVRYLKEIYGE